MIRVETVPVGDLEATVVTLANEHLTAAVTDLGARLLELHVPDRAGRVADIVLGRPDLATAFADTTYMGATVGRSANRIGRARFQLDGQEYRLPANEGRNHLHGGPEGFDRRQWTVSATEDGVDDVSVTLALISPDGDQGYPGEVSASCRYRLDGSSLEITMSATASASTVVNLTNHAYFNLGGHDAGTVLGHEVTIAGEYFTPVDDELIATGEILRVEGTPLDFRGGKLIGADLARVPSARPPGGYDHNWILDATDGPAITVTDPESGRRVELRTNQRGVQFYTGGYLGGITAKGELASYDAFAGFTLETQGFPGAATHPHFPSLAIRPGESYRNWERLTFSTA